MQRKMSMKSTKEKNVNSNIGFWERFAKIYTIVQEKGNKELYSKLTGEILSVMDENKDVLELACGTGQITFVLADKSFDIVLIANALHIMPDPGKALSEIRRVLKDDGVLIAPTFVYSGKINHFKIRIMEKAGFHTFYKWKKKDFVEFIQSNGFFVLENKIISGKVLSECFLTGKKDKNES